MSFQYLFQPALSPKFRSEETVIRGTRNPHGGKNEVVEKVTDLEQSYYKETTTIIKQGLNAKNPLNGVQEH